MASRKNRIDFQVGFNVDKSGLSEMQSLFQQIAFKAQEPANKMTASWQQAAKTATTLDNILSKTFNTDLGTLNVTKFNQELTKSGLSLKTIQNDFSKVGNMGANAYNRLAQAVLGTNQQLRESSKLLDNMFTTFKNTVRYGISSSIFNNLANSISKAYEYSRKLDTSLNNIRIVTDKSADSMAQFAQDANEAAKNLGASTLDYTNAALIYYQQGLSDQESRARAETTIKAANITGQTGEEVSEQLTAVWNGYKVTAAETELYVDKLAAVAATTAADLEELSLGMSKVASAANAMGVDFDDLNAQIATIVSVTRQAPESVGTALKTIYARLGDLKVDGVDEFGVSLGEVSSQLQTMGIQILDQNGDLRDMSSVMAEVAEKWQTWTSAQRQAAAIAMAGKRQYNNLVALFENWDMYTDALNTSVDAMGTLQHQQDIYMESTAAKLKTLKAAWQGLYDDAINEDEINTGIEALTNLVEVFDQFIDSFGGGIKSLTAFGAIVSNIFNRQIAEGINAANQRINVFKNNLELARTANEVRQQGANQSGDTATSEAIAANTQAQIEMSKRIYEARLGLNQEQTNTLIGYQKEIGLLTEQITYLEKSASEVELTLHNHEKVSDLLNIEKNKLEEINDDYGIQELKQENLVKNLKQQYDKIQQIKNTQYKQKDLEESFAQVAEKIDTKYKRQFNSLVKKLSISKNYVEVEKQIYDLIEKAVIKEEKTLKTIQEEENILSNVSKLRDSINSKKEQKQNIQQQADALLDMGKNATTVTQRVVSITSALGGMAMAWGSINSLIDTWNNKEANFGDKITQTLMTLGMTIPMAISNFKKLNEVLGISLAEIISETEATELLAFAENKEAAAEELQILTSKGHSLAKIKLIAQTLLHKTALDKETASELANAKAQLYSQAVRTAWIGGITLAIAAIAAITKAIDNYHEKQKEEAEETLKSIQTKQEETKANQELYVSYDKLYQQYRETHEVSSDLYNSAIKVGEAYDIQGTKVLALAGNYEELTRRIKEKQNAELEEQRRDAERGARSAAVSAAETARGGRGRTAGTGGHYYYEVNGSSQDMVDALKAAGIVVESDPNSGTFSAVIDIDYKESPEAMAKWADQVDTMIKYYDEQFRKNAYRLSFYNELIEEQNQLAESTSKLREQLDLTKTIEVQQAFANIDIENVKSAQELYAAILKVQNQLGGEEGSYDDFITQYIEGTEKFATELNKIDLAKRIDPFNPDRILDDIKDFNDSQLGYLEAHLDIATLDDDIDNWVKESKALEYAGTSAAASVLKNVLSNYKVKEGITEEQQSVLYNNEQVKGFLPSETSFLAMAEDEKINAIVLAWIEATKQALKYRDATLEGYKEDEKALQEQINLQKNAQAVISRAIDSQIADNEKLKEQRDEIYRVSQKLAQGDAQLSQEEQDLVNIVTTETKITEKQLKQYGEQANKIDSLIDTVRSLQKEEELLSSLTENHVENAQKLTSVLEAQSSVMDSIQSSYQSLTSIIDDYNKNGSFTIDNVQELIKLDDKYVASLEIENGQLTLNEDYLQAVSIAKLEDMKQTILLKMNEDLLALAERQSAEAADQNTAAQISQKLAVEQGIEAAKEGSEAWLAYAEAQRAAAGVTDDAEYQAIVNATKVRLDAVQSAIDSIKKGGSSMKSALGKSSSKSGGSSKEKELKQLEDEFDRYWEIHKVLDLIDRDLKRIDKDQQNLHGKELIRSLKQENEMLANQSQLYEQLAAAQEQEAAELRGSLASSGVAFDASGAVINYAQATAQALAEYNQAIQAYNNGLLDDAAFKIHEQRFEQFKKDLERYDNLFYKEMQETQEKLDDIRRNILANNLKAWDVEIQLKLDFKELERDWNDFIKEVTSDFKKVFKDLRVDLKTMLTDAQTYLGNEGTLSTIFGAVHDVTGEIDKLMSGGSSDMFESVSQAQEKLKELNDKLLDSSRALHDLWEDSWDNYIDGIDQVSDAFDDLLDRFERIDDELEFQGKLIELLYGDEAYGLFGKLYGGQANNTGAQIQSVKQQVDMWRQLFDASGATMENQLEWEEDQKEYYSKWMAAQEKLNDLVIEYIELLKKDYLNTVSDILKQFDKFVSGSSLEHINEQWERIAANADKYYDSVEGAYYIQNLANKISESIAATSDLKAQQKLMNLREKEIGYLREKENLTEYDIKAAELRYQIALKEIALENAQNNKTGMKLTRNDQGNWSYQYVADEEDIASKRQDLLDTYNSLYQLASDAYESNLEALTELQEKYLESAKKIYEDDTITEEERQQKLLELREWYLEQYKLLSEENQLYRNDLATSGAALLLEIYRQDEEAYEAMTDKERELVDTLINANIGDYMELEDRLKDNYQEIGDKAKEVMTETRADWTSGAQTIADLWNKDSGWSVKVQVTQAYDAIEEANRKYKEAVDWCAAAVERDFGEEGITGAIRNAGYETDNLREKTIDLVNSSIPYLQELRAYVDQIGAAWKSVQQEIMNTIGLIDAYLRKVGEANSAAQRQASIGSMGNVGTVSGGRGSGSGGSSNGSTYRVVNALGTNPGNWNTIAYGVDKDTAKNYYNNYDDIKIYDEKLKKYVEFASGGYTGSWGGSGKLAMLHEKELVLNKADTENFLSGINMIRSLVSDTGSIERAVLKAAASMAYSLGNVSVGSVPGISNTNNSTDNVFNITAEFPNANNVDDIRQAILTLPNIASQFVNSNLK